MSWSGGSGQPCGDEKSRCCSTVSHDAKRQHSVGQLCLVHHWNKMFSAYDGFIER